MADATLTGLTANQIKLATAGAASEFPDQQNPVSYAVTEGGWSLSLAIVKGIRVAVKAAISSGSIPADIQAEALTEESLVGAAQRLQQGGSDLASLAELVQ